MSKLTRCCETGRPIGVDGSGRTVCSCQLQRGVPSYLARVPTLPENVYGIGNSMYSQNNMLSAMYKMYGHDVHADTVALTAGIPHPVIPMNAHAMAAHPYGLGYSDFDIHGARRKNATRETTSPLKAWLYSHKKNPYPTKAEKIMLAIVTRMTLTQVSTWFANARRRLKKEHRLNGKDDDTFSDISGKDESIDIDTSSDHLIFPDGDDVCSSTGNLSDISETSDTIVEHNNRTDRLGKKCVQKLFSPDGRNELYLERLSSPELSERETSTFKDDVKFPLSMNGHSFRTFDIQERNKSISVDGHIRDISNTHKSETVSTIEVSGLKTTGISPKHIPQQQQQQQKPKIWSIAQIIGS